DELPYDPVTVRTLPVDSPGFDPTVFSARYAKWPPFARRNLATLTRAAYGDSDLVEVILHANVTELLPNRSDGNIVETLAKSFSGATVQVRAKYFVVSMGTLETIRLLLSSRSVAKEGIGNQSGWLGRNFQDHLSIQAAELMPNCPRQFEKMFSPFFIGNTM